MGRGSDPPTGCISYSQLWVTHLCALSIAKYFAMLYNFSNMVLAPATSGNLLPSLLPSLAPCFPGDLSLPPSPPSSLYFQEGACHVHCNEEFAGLEIHKLEVYS